MKLSYRDFQRILNIGIELTTEKEPEKLLNSIIQSGMDITHCDASTLYLYENNQLVFKIMKTLSQNISRGEDGQPIDMPPVPYKEENVCAYTAIHRSIVNIPDVYNSEKFDFSGPKRYDSLTGYRTKSMLVVPLEDNEGELVGVLQMINAMDEDKTVISFDPQYEIIIRSLGCLAAIELTNIRYVEEIKSQLRSFVEAMATAIDERTPYNGSHTRKVAEYSLLLANKINQKHKEGLCQEYYDETHKERLELAALLHDIGKMIIPRDIMNRATRLDQEMKALEDRFALLQCCYQIDYLKGKITQEEYEREKNILERGLDFVHKIDNAGCLKDEEYQQVQFLASKVYANDKGEKLPYLTEAERECLSIRRGTLTESARLTMESHVKMTAKILSKVRFNKNYSMVPAWAAEHHEFLNGSGYPNHLEGAEIPAEARILTVADIYDALTARDRPYKEPMPPEKAFFILKNMAEEGKVEERLVLWLQEVIEEVEVCQNK